MAPSLGFHSISVPAPCHLLPPRAFRHRIKPVHCGPRVRIVSVGKTKEKWLEQAIDEYIKRLRPTLALECQWVRDDAALEAAWTRTLDSTERCIVLDERGPMCDSQQFTSIFFKQLEEGGSRLSFFIGGAEGLPPAIKATPKAGQLSLSRLTMTHQMVRLLLVEQVYRASEIRRGSKYHKD